MAFVRATHISLQDIIREHVVEQIVHDLVNDVELCEAENCRLRALHDAKHAKITMDALKERIKCLEDENTSLNDKVHTIQHKAAVVRETFVAEIGELLSESRTITSLRAKLKSMELKLHTVSSLETELSQTYTKLKELEDQLRANNQPKELLKRKPRRPLLLQLDDKMILMVFSFLQTGDVLYAAQACRSVFKRVDGLFGIGSKIVKEEWSLVPQENAVGKSAEAVTGGLSKQVADSLSKKLTAPELKAIVAMTEKLKKQHTQLEQVTAEKEDALARLQSTETVRDFLIKKLKDAETALKGSMDEITTLKKQAVTDHEVISFLDNQNLDLQSINNEVTKKCEYLNASIELLRGTTSHVEKRLTAELAELKEKYESSEANNKSQKKLLVKEVKTLRSQLESIREERDAYAEQLQVLRQALNGGVFVKARRGSTTSK